MIQNSVNGKLYIGRKYFTKLPPKKKGQRRKRVESDWKDYYSSCKELQEDVMKFGKENFSRHILSLHPTQGDTNYYETVLLFQNNVLEAIDPKGEKIFYNANILGKYYYRLKNVKARILSNNIKDILSH